MHASAMSRRVALVICVIVFCLSFWLFLSSLRSGYSSVTYDIPTTIPSNGSR
jgi:multidrug transporter EmrE-like cation transporter